MTTMLDTTTAELDATVAGPVLEPGDPGYAEEVASFSLTFTAAPAVVVGATSAGDVAAAVRYAARTGRRVAVQSTGHGLQSDLAGTVLVSTHRMDRVAVDPDSATARVQAGARWRQVIDAAAPHGLAPLNGSSAQGAWAATPSAVASARWRAATASPPTTSAGSPSSPRTA